MLVPFSTTLSLARTPLRISCVQRNVRTAVFGRKLTNFGARNCRPKTGSERKQDNNWRQWYSRAGNRSSRSGSHGFSRGHWIPAFRWVLVGSVPILQVSSPTTANSLLPRSPTFTQPQAKAHVLSRRESRLLKDDLLDLVDGAISAIVTVFRLSWRFVQLALLFGPVIVTFPVWYLCERHTLKLGLTPRLWWVRFLVWSFEVSGPTFTKLGQWASSRADLFPPYVCAILSRLQSQVTPHSLAQTRKAIRKEFGMDLMELFEEFDEKPIGVGAIAQVYRAQLRPSTATQACSTLHCAVKVLHPGVDFMIHADLTIMQAVASIINLLPDAEWLSLPEEVAMFGSMMREQLDLRHEARNLDRFSNNFKDRPEVGFPKPITSLVRKTVLVEEYVDAIPMSKFLTYGHTPFDHDLAKIGLDSFLKMLVLDNFVHADLHPGNIFVTFRHVTSRTWQSLFRRTGVSDAPEDMISAAEIARLVALTPAEWPVAMERLARERYQPRLVFLDAGLVSELSPENLRNFLDLFRAVAEFDGTRVAKLMIERSRTPHTVIDPEGFERTMADFLNEVKRETLKLGNIKVGDILAKVFTMVRTHHIKIEGDFANVGVSIMLLEGMGRRLDPDIDLLKEALPILRQAAREGKGGAYQKSALRELGSGKTYWKVWVYHTVKPLLLAAEVVNIPIYEKARIYFPE
ncbi:atypical/ABC1/ABC1-C protein kinase [Spizellomyces punctatus DAOM BR117]|uniref:Atypical/ABC1/ABC1-C protein kinase n=1 Tax=Spizellomyces punctatus (strain DAOM BR117) TaxID=645134 RepID=A0A0L0HRH6_SPIPD|nr:atypical/ABC1/ABC1-C protein kinase [Spizellomyces punctatus DAOM BR117]KND03540.1 atypical/ABC1/ABC1-C protein kinase [Spizellomyces punctatus DAOM BR117]|eukprot:XP_016611579.1 atypical/ABC1/ABC1-C protein kinase [Spizellomyces punctatus DAOM BR117]